MIALPYLLAGTLAAGVAMGGWGGYQMGAARYLTGFQAGVASQQKVSDAEIARLQAESRAEAEIARRVASDQSREQERRYEARIQSAHDAAEQRHAATAAATDRLRARLRAPEARAQDHLPDGPGRVPEATDGAEDGPTLADWLVSERGGRRVVRLAERAEQTLTDLLECREGWPQ